MPSWFVSYISGRFQSVSFKRTLSIPSSLLYCVPQGFHPIVLYTFPVFAIVISHSLSHHSFSDDNQLYVTGPASELSNLVSSSQSCISQLKSWMNVNKLKLNEDKTEMILISPPKPILSLPSSVDPNGCSIIISYVRNHGVTLDQSLSLRQLVAVVCRLCNLEIRRISSVRRLLIDGAIKTLIFAFVLYCNALQNTSLKKSGKFKTMLLESSSVVPNLIMSPPPSEPAWTSCPYENCLLAFFLSVSKFLNQLRHLIVLICYIYVYTPSRQLCSSSDDRLLRVLHITTKSYGQRSFAYHRATTWNQLPLSVRHSDFDFFQN